MKWVDKGYYRRKEKWQWHRHFVWLLPQLISERRVGDLVVPQHFVWLGWTERRKTDEYGKVRWEYRTSPSE